MKNVAAKKTPVPSASLKAVEKYGYFDDRTNEFVITTPLTPRPWENRIWNEELNLQISNHGTGVTYTRNNKDKFVLFNYHHPNRCVYVYDRGTKTLWAPNWYPVNAGLDRYEVRHGLKYTVFRAEKDGLEVTWRVTVHARDTAELWRIEVRNTSRRKKDILLVPFYQVDLHLSDPYFEVDFYKSSVSLEKRCLYIKNHACVRKGEDDALGFHASRPFKKFEMNMGGFLKEFGTLSAPTTVTRDAWSNSLIDDDRKPCFAAGFDLAVAPGRTLGTDVEIFKADTFADAQRQAVRYAAKPPFDPAVRAHAAYAKKLLSLNTIRTEDPILDRFANVWIKHQTWYNAEWNRGWGQGFRDCMSDGDLFRMFDPRRVRTRILQAAAHVFADGHTVRKFFPPAEKPYFDGGIWFQHTIAQYIRETGDWAILKEEVPYYKSDERDTLLGHIKRTVAFLDQQRGPDGICRMGFGDWNDAVNGIDREGRGQSIWTTMAYIFGLKNVADVLEQLNDPDAKVYAGRAAKLTEILNTKFFEGDRYVRAVTDAGRIIGSQQNKEGRIFIEPQGWALFTGVAGPERAERIVEAVRRELYVPYGVMLMSPPFTVYQEDVGRLSNDPPGIIENGSNYVHGSLFYIYGLTQVDKPDEAWDLLHRVLPTNPLNPPEQSTLEPFQITNSYQGPASRHPGRCMFAWRTGAAAWFMKTVWDGLIGIRPDFSAVKVRAHVPAAFGDRVQITRQIRGVPVRFELAKAGCETPRARFTLRVQNGADIPYEQFGRKAHVLVTI